MHEYAEKSNRQVSRGRLSRSMESPSHISGIRGPTTAPRHVRFTNMESRCTRINYKIDEKPPRLKLAFYEANSCGN